MPERPDLSDRFLGCLLGLAVGDALGAPYEGLTSSDIFFRFGAPDVIARNPSGDTLFYTDDTEMMIGVAETLVEHGEIRGVDLIKAFVANYHPERGYGRGARQILETAQAGGDWKSVAETIFPGGSLGNGAAMRVAPVGLAFHADDDKVWEQARKSALPTHRHPIGIEGGQLFALAVALAVRSDQIDRKEFLTTLYNRAETEEFRWCLRAARRLRRGDSISALGSTLHAHQSVGTAIACFAACPADYELAVGRAIGLGDDTDTLAAMTGALCGAFGGVKAIPAVLLDKLEDGQNPKGKSHIIQLATRLYERFQPEKTFYPQMNADKRGSD
ncbi:ADP-ribosylglycohydrolase family protein [Fimbriiglobus ruber]|uniref:Putative hydrolase n=1 Tax=Fimbriiglobus ruber TaxID=1908690 RepID=A0A225DPB4_9BACT|nr:ADP-ribosylglycohydrolase family protein [Fimbriiglobus ruber]OWK43232.1 putative hydrolase [Fimbriiglobus ruber]